MKERDQQYVEFRLLGFTPWQSAKRCGSGYPERDWRLIEEREEVKRAIAEGFAENRRRFEVTREDVIGGIKEGIEVAKLTDDAGNMIKGWSEIAKICGLVAPERKEVVINTELPLLPQQLQTLPDALLLRMIGKTRELEVIDGDFDTVEQVPVGGDAVFGEEEGGAVRDAELAVDDFVPDVREEGEAGGCGEELLGAGCGEVPQAAAVSPRVQKLSGAASSRASARFFAKTAARKSRKDRTKKA